MNTTAIILDLLVLGILAVFLFRGLSKGIIMMLSGFAALVAGIFGGSYIAKIFSKPVGNALILPWVSKTLNLAAQGEQIPDGALINANGQLSESAAGSITGIMESSKLPRFSFEGIIESIGQYIKDTGADLLKAASEVIAERIAYVALFIVAFIAIQVIVHLVFRLIDIVSKAPVLNTLNRFSGGAVGLITGALLILLLMWAASAFIKPATAEGGILSENIIEQSYIAKYFDMLKKSVIY